MLLIGRNLGKSYGPRRLFGGITLGLNDGERAGLIGPNGSGKTTLLKLFAGLEQPDEGEVESRRGLRVGFVPQEEAFEDRAASDLVAENLDPHLDDHERHLRAEQALKRVGFDEPAVRAGGLSGGWRKRLSIAAQLAKEPELLLMDEPTNHLDLDGVLWLQGLIRAGNFASLVVTHDRRFLEEAATRIIELDRAYPDGYLSHDGAYSAFLEKRDGFLIAQKGREQSLASGVRREIEWLRRGAKARTTKAKGRIERAGEMTAELAELRTRNADRGRAVIDFEASGRKTRKLVELKTAAKSLGGRHLFSGLGLTLAPGTRLGLLGPNGSGKTTLIRLIVGELAPDIGTVFRADGLQIVLFDQHREQLDLGQSLRRALFPAGDTMSYRGQPTHVVGWARRFLFRTEQLDLPLRELSGGERARVLLARLMLKPADVLILDEPTNDLDIATLDVLEESLESFPGAVVLVTHDRYLLDRVSTELLALDGRGGASAYASLDQWERSRDLSTKREADAKRAASAPSSSPVVEPGKKKLTWKEQRELEQMEATILAAEGRAGQLQAQVADPAVMADRVRMADACQRLSDAQHEVERLYARWGELEERR